MAIREEAFLEFESLQGRLNLSIRWNDTTDVISRIRVTSTFPAPIVGWVEYGGIHTDFSILGEMDLPVSSLKLETNTEDYLLSLGI